MATDSSIERLVNRFIEESFYINTDFSKRDIDIESIRPYIVQGLNKMYSQLFDEAQKTAKNVSWVRNSRVDIDYILPVRLVLEQKDSFMVEWVYKLNNNSGWSDLFTSFLVYKLPIVNEVPTYQVSNVEVPLKEEETNFDKILIDHFQDWNTVLKTMRKRRYNIVVLNQLYQEMKLEQNYEEMEKVGIPLEDFNLLLTNEQVRNNSELCQRIVSREPFKPIDPTVYKLDVARYIALMAEISIAANEPFTSKKRKRKS